LEDPDEVWVEQTDTGERHYTFITHFRNGEERISYVVVCLAIDGAPSFVFLGFPSRDENLVDEFRRGTEVRTDGEPMDQLQAEVAALPEPVFSEDEDNQSSEPSAQPEVSAFERLYGERRQAGDIPRELFERFEVFVEPTLEDPDEIWRFIDEEGNEWCTFISTQVVNDNDSEIDEFTMVAVCEPSVLENGARSFEVVFAFPTIDPGLVQYFRKGVNSLNKAFGVGWTRGRAA
jgi:hypothetical protein